MKILMIVSSDATVKNTFQTYQNLSERFLLDKNANPIELLKSVENTRGKLERLLMTVCNEKNPVILDEEYFDGIDSVPIKNRLMYGLYDKDGLEDLMKTYNSELNNQILSVYNGQLQKMTSNHFLLIWNIGEDEVDAFVQD